MSIKKSPLTEQIWKKQQNWYLRGWEYRAEAGRDGRERNRLVYTREYYKLSLPGRKRRLAKVLAAALCLVMVAVYVLFETTLSQGGLVWYAGAPCLLGMIPMFYLVLGVINFVLTEDYFTYRRMYAAYTRMRLGGRLTCLLFAMGTIGQVVFLLRYGRALELGPELGMLSGAAVCALCAGALTLLQRKVPCEEVSPKEYPGEKKGG